MTFCVRAIIPLERAVLGMIGGLMILKQESCSEVAKPQIIRSCCVLVGQELPSPESEPSCSGRGRDMAYQFFIHRVPGKSLIEGFSEANKTHQVDPASHIQPMLPQG